MLSDLIAARRAVVTVDFLRGLAVPNQDPIFAAIGAHRAATAGVLAIIEAHNALETELPNDKRCSIVTVCGEEIVATDDPRWIDCQRAVVLAWKVQDETAVALLNVRPTTLRRDGVVALCGGGRRGRSGLARRTSDGRWQTTILASVPGRKRCCRAPELRLKP